ncbi:uncharacterized protein Z518_09564 [Rhinocladiella mackenziei CBS 650.93]|uniref:Uncharacterized protein n=1 Tax=Rhinocladiella mackenziei CBS 650.93 TaxID=1442369 RepID=A0A0D2FII0_9EURO|nr:uncharacterized protein Z518_09564 [Rhinocladiella mackenziei CBS 650.93]KIX01837.1 hypothetical protein Z518_09564 [Rhinocladiella mackenziei CBS 650.93]
MEEPFRKRPRLSIFAGQPSDTALDQDLSSLRHQNDNLLKSRFESIFEKYSHDFSGIGDEIDLGTGKIVVNNGHLEGMKNETDLGRTASNRENAKGQSLLRAMTRMPDGEDSYFDEGADDVIMSIEEMAENAAMSDDGSNQEDNDEELFTPVQYNTQKIPQDTRISHDKITQPDSDEELFVPVQSRPLFVTIPDSRGSNPTVQSDPFESDRDSLFEIRPPPRSASPDSLFEVQRIDDDSASMDRTNAHIGSSGLGEDVDESAILDKFGPQIGREVLGIVQKARNTATEAHIEPAWRIPANVIPPKVSRSFSKLSTPPSPIAPRPDVAKSCSPDHDRSLWEPKRQRPKRRSKDQALTQMRIRAESEDPLQEGFVRDSGGDSDWETKQEREEEYVVPEDEQVVLMKQGICLYCSKQWASRSGVWTHWCKLLGEAERLQANPDEVHDIHYLRHYRSRRRKIVTVRSPRLVLGDFRTLVELHEGAGLSFVQIAQCRALRTRKTGPALNDVYDRYRSPPGHPPGRGAVRDWSEEEMKILNKLCENPKADLGTFSRQFQNRSSIEIGDKLAEIWLEALWKSGQIAARPSQIPTTPTEEQGIESTPTPPQRSIRQRESSIDNPFVKEEESEDEGSRHR